MQVQFGFTNNPGGELETDTGATPRIPIADGAATYTHTYTEAGDKSVTYYAVNGQAPTTSVTVPTGATQAAEQSLPTPDESTLIKETPPDES